MVNQGSAALPHAWVAGSAEVARVDSDSGSDGQPAEDFIDVDSDRDIEVESVTDA